MLIDFTLLVAKPTVKPRAKASSIKPKRSQLVNGTSKCIKKS